MRLCTFQGTFNPFHKAHEAMARYVLENFEYDKVLLIPAYCPPHKQEKIKNSATRYDMTKAFVLAHPEFEISDIEFKRKEPSYTYITITELYKIYEVKEKIGFIIGEDSFLQIETWYETDLLKDLVDFIVFPRTQNFSEKVFTNLKKKGYNYIVANHKAQEISSTEIRSIIKKEQNTNCVSHLLPKEIEEYIKNNELYI